MARILVVEDSPDNMKLFRAVLTLRGHEVTGLGDGRGLIESLAASPPDLILMDIQLPECDGFVLLEEIRLAGYSELPVVALTAHAMAGDRERALDAGFCGYITKPIDIAAFPGQVESLIGRASGTDLASGGEHS